MVFTFLTAFIILLAMISEASYYETLVVRLLAVIAITTSVLLWFKSRYSLYAMEILFFGIVTGSLLPFDDPDNHTLLGASARFANLAFLLWAGYRCRANAKPFADAHSVALDNERSQVRQWMATLDSPEHSDQVVELSTTSFWTGYWRYRLFNTGSCWLVEKFKMGKTNRLLESRVRELGTVHIVEQPEGKLSIVIGDASIPKVDLTSDMRSRLNRLVGA